MSKAVELMYKDSITERLIISIPTFPCCLLYILCTNLIRILSATTTYLRLIQGQTIISPFSTIFLAEFHLFNKTKPHNDPDTLHSQPDCHSPGKARRKETDCDRERNGDRFSLTELQRKKVRPRTAELMLCTNCFNCLS